jgi:hypothetical protein
MAIIANKIITAPSKTVPETHPEVLDVKIETLAKDQHPLERKFVIERKQVKGVASGATALVVNGKKKSIGRKSHFLLDMLTLDDE